MKITKPAICLAIFMSLALFSAGCAGGAKQESSTETPANASSSVNSSEQPNSSSAFSSTSDSSDSLAASKAEPRGFKASNNELVDFIDFTGDGIDDIVAVEAMPGSQQNIYGDYCVTLNGESFFTSEEPDCLGVKIDAFTLESGDSFLWVHPSCNNDDGPDYIYKYENGDFSLLMDCDDIMGGIPGAHS